MRRLEGYFRAQTRPLLVNTWTFLPPQEVQQPQGGAAAVDKNLIVFRHQIGGVLADEIPVQLHLVGVSGGGDGLLRHSAAVETADQALVLQVL